MNDQTESREAIHEDLHEKPFDLSALKVELNNVTIMYGPAGATIRQAEKAMMAYISILCEGAAK